MIKQMDNTTQQDVDVCAVIADGDLPDLLSLIKSDILTGNSKRLQRCINYLKETAADFERAESKILKKLKEVT